MSAALHSLENWNAANKNLYLCDTFEPFGIDPETGRNDKRFGVRDTYAKSLSDVEANFSEWKRINFVVGFVPDSLQSVSIEKVAFLHIDLNNASAEVGALRHFWPKVVKGGIIVLDDYAQVASQNQAMNMLATEIGPIAKPKAIYFTPDLPKTRSGKIMRRLLRDVAEGRNLGDTSTLADASVVSELQRRATETPSED